MKNSKKILFILGSLGAGGTERVVGLLSNNLVKLGYEVTILSTGTEEKRIFPYFISDKVNIAIRKDINISIHTSLKSMQALKGLTHFICKNRFPCVVCMNDNIGLLLAPLLFFIRCKLFIAIRNDPNFLLVNQTKKTIAKLFNSSIKYIFQNQYQYIEYSRIIASPKRYVLLPNPVSLILTKNLTLEKRLYNIRRDKELVFIAIASKFFQKGVDYTIHAYLNSNLSNKSTLLLLGSDDNQSIQNYIAKSYKYCLFKANKTIKIQPKVKEIGTYLSFAHALIFPSRYEGMPNILLEAFFYNLPVLTSNHISSLLPLLMREKHITYSDAREDQIVSNLNKQLEVFSRSISFKEVKTNKVNEQLNDAYNKQIFDDWVKYIIDK